MSRFVLIISAISLAFALAARSTDDDVFKRNKPLYQQVIERVQKEEIKTAKEVGIRFPEKPTGFGFLLPSFALLPKELEAASVGGHVLISRPSPGQLVVVFATQRGMDFNMQGFLFAAKPLADRDLRRDREGNLVVLIDSLEFVIGKRIEENWYEVSRSVDLLRLNKPLYQQVIERLQKREIKTVREKGATPPLGSVRPDLVLPSSAALPVELQAASVGGEIYVCRPHPGQLIVIFATRRGKPFNMEGYLFATKPLTDRELQKRNYGTTNTVSVVEIDSIEFVIEKQVEENWYEVGRGLD